MDVGVDESGQPQRLVGGDAVYERLDGRSLTVQPVQGLGGGRQLASHNTTSLSVSCLSLYLDQQFGTLDVRYQGDGMLYGHAPSNITLCNERGVPSNREVYRYVD